MTLATRFHVVSALANDLQRVGDNPLPVSSPTWPNPVLIRRLRHPPPCAWPDINPLAVVAGVIQLISQNASLNELWGTTLRSQSCSALSRPRYRVTEERANHCLLLSVNLLLTTRPLVSPGPCIITRPTGGPSRPLPSSHVLPNGIWFNQSTGLYYATQVGITIKSNRKECKTFLISLMTSLEGVRPLHIPTSNCVRLTTRGSPM